MNEKEVRIEMGENALDLAMEVMDKAFDTVDEVYQYCIDYIEQHRNWSEEVASWEGLPMRVENGIIIIEKGGDAT